MKKQGGAEAIYIEFRRRSAHSTLHFDMSHNTPQKLSQETLPIKPKNPSKIVLPTTPSGCIHSVGS